MTRVRPGGRESLVAWTRCQSQSLTAALNLAILRSVRVQRDTATKAGRMARLLKRSWGQKRSWRHAGPIGVILLAVAHQALAQRPEPRSKFPDVDVRAAAARPVRSATNRQEEGLEQLRLLAPGMTVAWDRVTPSPRLIQARDSFLSGPGGAGISLTAHDLARFKATDPHRVTKAFIERHRALFGHGPERLDQCVVAREHVTPHNGMRTTIWQQEAEGLPVFEGLLISHVTRREELVNLSSRLMPDAVTAARLAGKRFRNLQVPPVSAARAVSLAAQNAGDIVEESRIHRRFRQAGGRTAGRLLLGRHRRRLRAGRGDGRKQQPAGGRLRSCYGAGPGSHAGRGTCRGFFRIVHQCHQCDPE